MTTQASLMVRHQDKISERVELSKAQLSAMGISPVAFERVALNALVLNPDLAECSLISVQKAVIQAINAGLMLDNREAALVPFNDRNSKQKAATLIPMVDGVIKLATQATPGMVIRADVVYRDDEFDFELGLRPTLSHRPSRDGGRSDADVVAAYAVASIPAQNVVMGFEVMFRGELDRIRAKSRARGGPWETDYPEMCRKTVIKRVCKRLPRGRNGAVVDLPDEFDYIETGVDGFGEIPEVEVEPPPTSRVYEVSRVVDVPQDAHLRDVTQAAIRKDALRQPHTVDMMSGEIVDADDLPLPFDDAPPTDDDEAPF